MRRITRPAVVACVLLLSLLFGRGAAAHLTEFQIWGTGIDIWAGAQNHYHNTYDTPVFAWDFMIPINAEVRQEAPSSFYWLGFRTGPGYDWNHNTSVKFSLWVWNQTDGAQLYTSSSFNCDPVTWDGTLFPYPKIYNPGSRGLYEQWSGSGGGFCYDSYTSKDYYAVYSR
jgi:hypothetical protein